MDIKYNITKLTGSIKEEVQDHVSVEEPLEMSLKFKKGDKWNIENISITMRTPGNDEDLISGFLYNERIIENINEIEKVEKKGETVGDYNLQNKIEVTINNTKKTYLLTKLINDQKKYFLVVQKDSLDIQKAIP